MSRHRHHRHESHGSGTPHNHVPYWKRAHTDWRFWVGIVVMLAAMAIYVLSGNLAGQPGLQPMPPAAVDGTR